MPKQLGMIVRNGQAALTIIEIAVCGLVSFQLGDGSIVDKIGG
jgi:hypothetical protein